MASIFSRIITRDIPGHIVAENDDFIAILDIMPLVKGHTLVIPKKEVDYIFDLDDDLLSRLTLFSKKVAKAVKATCPCERIGVAVIGLEVPHVHIHLVPMNTMDDINFSRPKMKLTPEELAEIAVAIQSNFSD